MDHQLLRAFYMPSVLEGSCSHWAVELAPRPHRGCATALFTEETQRGVLTRSVRVWRLVSGGVTSTPRAGLVLCKGVGIGGTQCSLQKMDAQTKPRHTGTKP